MNKFLFYGGCFLALSLAACSDDDPMENYKDPQEAEKVIQANTEMYSRFLVNGEIIEESIDSVLNLGSEEYPALFHVNQSHKVKGVNVPAGMYDLDYSFFSLNKEEHEAFIPIFAKTWGLTNSFNLSQETKENAYHQLFAFLKSMDIELAQLIYLSQGDEERLRATIQIADQYIETKSSGKPSLSNLYNQLLRNQTNPIDYYQQIEKNGFNENTQIQTKVTPATVTKIIKGVIDGVVFVSKVIIAFIENAKPIVDIENQYTSYLHEDDTNVMNYIDPTYHKSDSYECTYGSSLTPMAHAKFFIESYYNSKRAADDGRYISRIGMLVEAVSCTGSMHVEGETAFQPGEGREENNNPIAIGKGEVVIKYGDCCCFARTARLRFEVDGKNGYKQTSWDSNE